MRTCRYLGDRGLQAGAQGQHSAAGDTEVWGCGVPLSQGTLCLLGGGRIMAPGMDRHWHRSGG